MEDTSHARWLRSMQPSRPAPAYTLGDLALRPRTVNALYHSALQHGIDPLTLSDAQLLRLRNVGRLSLKDLRDAERAYLHHQRQQPPWGPPLLTDP